MEMHTRENERMIKTLQLEVRKEAAVSWFTCAFLLSHFKEHLTRTGGTDLTRKCSVGY